ncbi:MAG: hypothetical protein K1Y36_22540 [Blastocatellia bacterium]|nr:hypothetical protein [Blastocatellia bacterium]
MAKGFKKRKNPEKQGRLTARDVVQKVNLPPQTKIVTGAVDGVKMADVIREFGEPLLNMAQSAEDWRNLLELCIVAWNTALLPETEQRERLATLVRMTYTENQQEIFNVLCEMTARKNQLYAANRRYILNYEISGSGPSAQLGIASTLPETPREANEG